MSERPSALRQPQQLDSVLEENCCRCVTRSISSLSIAAGKKLAAIEAALPLARVIRVMPNVRMPGIGSDERDSIGVPTQRWRTVILPASSSRTSGRWSSLPEDQFDAVNRAERIGPAFFAFFLDKLSDAAVRGGTDRQSALLLAKANNAGNGETPARQRHGTEDAD